MIKFKHFPLPKNNRGFMLAVLIIPLAMVLVPMIVIACTAIWEENRGTAYIGQPENGMISNGHSS